MRAIRAATAGKICWITAGIRAHPVGRYLLLLHGENPGHARSRRRAVRCVPGPQPSAGLRRRLAQPATHLSCRAIGSPRRAERTRFFNPAEGRSCGARYLDRCLDGTDRLIEIASAAGRPPEVKAACGPRSAVMLSLCPGACGSACVQRRSATGPGQADTKATLAPGPCCPA